MLDDRFCEAVLRPRSTRTCYNRRCVGRWEEGEWSKVIIFFAEILLFQTIFFSLIS